MMTTPQELLRKGGAWLAAARKWLQWNVAGGDRVIWSSNDSVGQFTVNMVEDLASNVAHAAVVEEREACARLIMQLREEKGIGLDASFFAQQIRERK